jgi:hypothetical protein
VSEAFILRRLSEGTVLDIDLDRCEGDAVILDDDNLEAIRENAPLNDFLQLGTLAQCQRRQERERD